MQRVFSFTVWFFCFAQASQVLASTPMCLYTSVYNAGENTYLLFNIIEKLAVLNFANDEEFLAKWNVAQLQVQTKCGQLWDSTPQRISLENKGVSFFLKNSPYFFKKEANGLVQKTSLVKTSGNYANQNLISVIFRQGQKQFVHIVGREGPEDSLTRYDFVFNENGNLLHKSERDFEDFKNTKSLMAIYGEKRPVLSARLNVGVVGSGLDYNHPDLAMLVAHRSDMEDGLQRIESLRDKLKFQAYWLVQDLIEDKNEYIHGMNTVGFPRWMDQAMGSLMPFDQLYIDYGKTNPGHHETIITSRIISRGDNAVQLHFARRMFGSPDILDVETVIENFAKADVRLVNMSFGSECGQLPLEEARWEKVFAKYKQMVFVIASGNSGRNVDLRPNCPAVFSKKYKNVISVTALDSQGWLASYYGTKVNFGTSVDVAIRSDNLLTLRPFGTAGNWVLNEVGATSVAAAEVSRILTEAILDGYDIQAQKVKDQLIKTSDKKSHLDGLVGSSAEVNETAFRQSLQKKARKNVP